VIRLDQVSKSFTTGRFRRDRLRALDRLDWSCIAGESVAVVGPNGSGKTTLLRLAAGLLRPDAGTVRVAGLDPADHRREAQRRLGFLTGAAVPQPRLTARETLCLFGELHGLPAAEARRRSDTWIERLDLAGFANRLVGGLSAGLRQRVMVARALIHDPDILMLDEATTGLDPVAADAVCGIIREARAAGRTVVFSSHSPAEVEALATRLTILAGGRVLFDDLPAVLPADAEPFAAALIRRLREGGPP
jgi:ABC-type multidrug transport system ATPase subunit